MAPPVPSALIPGPMTDEALQAIFASDQDMYPAPLTLARLESWVRACPELSTCFYLPRDAGAGISERGALAGVSVVLPLLVQHWRDLLAGTLRETDIDAAAMLASGSISAGGVGLHVFHVERFSSRVKRFAEKSLQHALDTASDREWHLAGCSALTATAEGARSFQSLGFQPTGYQEIWVQSKQGGVELLSIKPGQSAEDACAGLDGSTIIGRASMMVRYSAIE
ncbi:hypothetical protein BX600DRAFT_513654 [Xylariales sp. PMI_506]|nr:hypothetical protein BX600DRAFT_513654 [Xylariales sp. PMI_506]